MLDRHHLAQFVVNLYHSSTPNGLNHFYKTCVGAQENKNGYIYIEVPWNKVPGRDDKWKKETLAAMDFDQQKFSQEFECAFLGSSGTLIEGSKLKNMVDLTPIAQSQTMKVYEQPEQGHVYCCIVDVSRGKGLDYSAFQIIDVSQMPYKQVCAYRDNNITPIDYAEIIYRSIERYNEAYTLIEINDIGEQVSEVLHYEFEVDTLMFTESAGRAGKRLSTGFSKNSDKGIRTTKNVKSIGCNMLKMLIEQDQLVLFGWMTDQAFFKEVTDINTIDKLRSRNEEELMESLLPIGFNTYDEDILEDEMAGTARWLNY